MELCAPLDCTSLDDLRAAQFPANLRPDQSIRNDMLARARIKRGIVSQSMYTTYT